MPTQKVIGSKTFTVPTSNDTGWGVTTTAYLLELGTYANQVAIASYDLTKNFRVNSTSTTADSKTVAQYGMESTFIVFKNYSASSAKFGAIRLPEFGPAGSDNTYNETSSTGSSLGTYVSHNQINWKLAGGYFYLHANNPATYSDAALVVQKLNTTNSPINNQTALAAAVANNANLNVDTIVLAKTAATLRNKSIDLASSTGNVISNSDFTDVVTIWDGVNLGSSAITKTELESLSGIDNGSTIETRLTDLENTSASVTDDIGNLGSIGTGIIAKTDGSGPEVYAARTITGTANKIVVTNGDGVSGNPTLNIGTDVVTLNDTQTLQNKTINTNINDIKGTASTMAHFNGSGNMITSNNLPDSITFPSNEGIESTSAASTLNVGTGSNTDTLNLGTSGSTSTVNIGTGAGVTTINIGGSGDTVNIAGTLVNVNTINMDVDDNVITVNKGGTTVNTSGSGISIEGDAGAEVGYIRSDSPRTGTEFKSGSRDGITDIRHSTAAATNILDLTSSNGNTYTYPATTGNVVIDSAAQTLSNKTVNNLLYLAESATVSTANLAPSSTPPKSIQRITSSSATLGTITNTGGAFHTELILMNVSGGAISVLNDSGSSSTSILTGTGAPISLADKASIIVIYDSVSSRWRVIGGSGSGGAGSAVTNNVNFGSAHSFSVGDWLYLNGTTYTKVINSSEAAAQPVGVVTTVIDANNFTITTSGVATGLSGLTAGAVHYVASTAGTITATKPFITSQFEAPVGIAISTTSIYVACQIAEPASRYTSNNEQPVKNYLREYANSSVDLGTITNSLGDTLASSDRTANKTTWGSSNTSLLTIARSTNSELRQSYNYLITEAGSSSGAFIESPLFTLDQVDIGKPVSVSFDVKGNAADGDYQTYIVRYNASNILQSRIVVAGNASTTSPFSAKLPTGTTTFNGFFVPDSTSTDHQYALRIVSNNSSAASLRIDTLFIGPQPVRVGAAITDWVAYTPTFNNVTLGNGTVSGFWRRSGDTLELFAALDFGTTTSVTGTITTTLPNNLVFDTSKYGPAFKLVGHALGQTASSAEYMGQVVSLSTTTLQVLNGSTSAAAYWSATQPTAWAGDGTPVLEIVAKLPIVGWSSNVTMADRAVEEYLFNTGSVTTAGGSDTTSFGYGPNGTPCNVFASSTGSSLSTTLRVRSTQPIQQTDTIVAEMKLTGQDPWYPVYTSGAISSSTLQAGTVYGMSLTRVSGSNTDIDVGFGNGGRVTNGATYGSAGAAWSASYLWRVRIIRAGAQVGYPISSANIVGRVDGNAPATGMVGETVTATITTTSITTSIADVTGASLALSVGRWRIIANVSTEYLTGATASDRGETKISITNSANTLINNQEKSLRVKTVAAVTNNVITTLSFSTIVNVTAAETYKLRGIRIDTAGTGIATVLNQAGYYSEFFAERIV